MTLRERQAAAGAVFAQDGIPLHFGDLSSEYHAALEGAVLMDRSHEGRIEIHDEERAELLHRMSTNDLLNMTPGEGRPTLFTNANARILDRALVYNCAGRLLVITEAGRSPALVRYLQRHIFFGDKVNLKDITGVTRQFALHGPQADNIISTLTPHAASLPPLHATSVVIADEEVVVARREPISAAHWIVIAPYEQAAPIWSTLLDAGQAHDLVPAGSLTYNTLRVRAGRPAAGRELTPDYIPLEAGLWDEVSFSKGCYTGQEVIARMESRNRLAKTLVRLRLAAPVEPPADLHSEGRKSGTLTSSATTPEGEHLGLGFVKLDVAVPGNRLTVGADNIDATITALAGVLPPRFTDANAP